MLDDLDPNSARIYAIVARAARRAVVFRRGPSRRVRLILWNLQRDTIEAGQWFKGRIYERRCDLTPDGDKLAYFAASFRKPFYSWTAISRPPYLTALALWPKGNCWGGGGLFTTERDLQLNHRPRDLTLAPGFALPGRFRVSPLENHSGGGEDHPITSARLLREGWKLSSEGKASRHGRRSRYSWIFDPPQTTQKYIHRRNGAPLILRIELQAVHERQGRWYVQTGDLLDQAGQTIYACGRIDWADFDHNGDVLFAKDGCLYRLPKPVSLRRGRGAMPRLIADLNGMSFDPIKAPDWARSWDESKE